MTNDQTVADTLARAEQWLGADAWARYYLDTIKLVLDLVACERRCQVLQAERNEARYHARVLASAWKDDCRPPHLSVDAALTYAVDQRVTASEQAAEQG